MKVVLQRVAQAAVDVDGERIAQIGRGLLALVGVQPHDDAGTVAWMADKILGLRIFADEHKPMNQSVADIRGEILLVSQFTLVADTRRGRRPGFSGAAQPALAEAIYTRLAEALRAGARVSTGRFGADMQVSLVNDGPVTLLLER